MKMKKNKKIRVVSKRNNPQKSKSEIDKKPPSGALSGSGSSSKIAASSFNGITPLADRVLVKPFLASEGEVKNSFGIIIPDTAAKEQPEQGKVVAVGLGRFDHASGKIVPMTVKVGDVVIFSKYGFDEVKVDEKELYIIKEENILAVVKN